MLIYNYTGQVVTITYRDRKGLILVKIGTETILPTNPDNQPFVSTVPENTFTLVYETADKLYGKPKIYSSGGYHNDRFVTIEGKLPVYSDGSPVIIEDYDQSTISHVQLRPLVDQGIMNDVIDVASDVVDKIYTTLTGIDNGDTWTGISVDILNIYKSSYEIIIVLLIVLITVVAILALIVYWKTK